MTFAFYIVFLIIFIMCPIQGLAIDGRALLEEAFAASSMSSFHATVSETVPGEKTTSKCNFFQVHVPTAGNYRILEFSSGNNTDISYLLVTPTQGNFYISPEGNSYFVQEAFQASRWDAMFFRPSEQDWQIAAFEVMEYQIKGNNRRQIKMIISEKIDPDLHARYPELHGKNKHFINIFTIALPENVIIGRKRYDSTGTLISELKFDSFDSFSLPSLKSIESYRISAENVAINAEQIIKSKQYALLEKCRDEQKAKNIRKYAIAWIYNSDTSIIILFLTSAALILIGFWLHRRRG